MVDGEIAPADQQRLWQHLQTCSSCRSRYRELQALRARLKRTNWASLWAKAVSENRRLRRWFVAGILLTALLSVSATFGIIRYLRPSLAMTPQMAIGIVQYHQAVAPEWVFNLNCPSSQACLTQKTNLAPLFLSSYHLSAPTPHQVGLCTCLGQPVVLYRFTIQRVPVTVLHFHTHHLPLKVTGSYRVLWCDQPLHCFIISEIHLLMWEKDENGIALAVPYGSINPLELLPKLGLP